MLNLFHDLPTAMHAVSKKNEAEGDLQRNGCDLPRATLEERPRIRGFRAPVQHEKVEQALCIRGEEKQRHDDPVQDALMRAVGQT